MHSIKTHLAFRLVGGFVLLSIAGISLLYSGLRWTLLSAFDERLAIEARSVITFARMEDGQLRLDFCDRYLRAFATNQSERETHFFEVWNADGSVLARSASMKTGRLEQRFGTLDQPAIWNLILPNGRSGRAVGFRYKESRVRRALPAADPELCVVVAGNREEIDKTLSRLLWSFLVVAVLSCASGGLWVALSLKQGLAPLDRLATHTSEIDAHTLGMRFPLDRLPAELKPISTRLNQLLERIEAGFERERRFNADIAHELRTPLTELRTLAEVRLRQSHGRETTAFADVLASTLQMERIVNCLLALSRCDTKAQAVNMGPVNLAAICSGVIDSNRAKAVAREILLETCVPENIVAFADAALLRSILQNLIENAIAYSPTGSSVAVSAVQVLGEITLHVANRAEQLTPPDTERMFDRLWRKDTSRSPDGKHCGLGLAVARAFCDLQGVRIGVALAEHMLTVTLSLRAVTPEVTEPANV
jgi:signal transduction histidine kinase